MKNRTIIGRVIIFVSCILLSLVVIIFNCNQIVVSSTKGKVFNDINSIQPAEVGLLLGTTPQIRIGERKNMFFKYRIDATEELYLKSATTRLI